MTAPVEKVRIFEGSEAPVVVAIAGGDIFINDVHLFDHIAPWIDQLQTSDGFEAFANYFLEQWGLHFDAQEFSCLSEKENYLKKVKTTVFVARSPSDVSYFDGTCEELEFRHYHQFDQSLAFGTPTAEVGILNDRKPSVFGLWRGHLGEIFAEGVKHPLVSGPFDVVLWENGKRPFKERYSLEDLQSGR